MFSLEIHHCTSSWMFNSSHCLVNQGLYLVKLFTWPYHLAHSIQFRRRSPQLFHTFAYLHRYITSVGTVSKGVEQLNRKDVLFHGCFQRSQSHKCIAEVFPSDIYCRCFRWYLVSIFLGGSNVTKPNIFGVVHPPRIPPWQMKGVYMDFPYCKISGNPGWLTVTSSWGHNPTHILSSPRSSSKYLWI